MRPTPAETTHRSCRRGMTLIELLLAVAMAGLVIALVFSVYRTVLRVASSQESRLAGAAAVSSSLEQLTRDLSCALPPAENVCGFELAPDDDSETTPSRVAFCTTVARPDAEGDLRWSDAQSVAYRVKPESSGETMLVMERTPLRGPGAGGEPISEPLARGVLKFRVTAYDGSAWREKWPGEGIEPSALPRAIRIELALSGAEESAIEILIPAGNPQPSTVTRSGAAAESGAGD